MTSQQLLNWLRENWLMLLVVGVPWVAIWVLNKATTVWYDRKGFVRVAQFIISVLSPIPSAGKGWIKMPFWPESKPKDPADGGFIRLWFSLLVPLLLLLLSSCASTQLGKLAQIQASGSALRQSSTLVLDNRCSALVPACPDGGLEKCKPYQKCRAMKLLVYGASSSLQVSIDAAASLVAIGEEKRAEALMPAIKDGFKRLLDLLEAYNVVGAVQVLSGKEGAEPVEVVKTVPPPTSAPVRGVK